MDMLYWNADKTAVPRDVFDACLDRILHADALILDGNYNRTMEMRCAACDTVPFNDNSDYRDTVSATVPHRQLSLPS